MKSFTFLSLPLYFYCDWIAKMSCVYQVRRAIEIYDAEY